MRALFDWQTAVPCRQVVLLSGDVHAASASTIRRSKRSSMILECTSNPLATQATRVERWLNVITIRDPNWLEPELYLERHFLALANNYGLVQLRPLPEGGHCVEFTVRAWDQRSRAFQTAGRLESTPEQRHHRRETPASGACRSGTSGAGSMRAFHLLTCGTGSSTLVLSTHKKVK